MSRAGRGGPSLAPAAGVLLLATWLAALGPHAFRVSPWVVAATALLGSWRVYREVRKSRELGRWLVLGCTVLGALGVGLTAPRPLGRDAALTLLFLLAGLKLLELRTTRDRILLIFLCWFLLLANLLYDQSLAAAGHMGLTVFVSAGALVCLADGQGGLGFRGGLAVGGRLLAQALPLTLIVFLLFPRVSGRLWGLPADAHRGLSGLSESMTPGSVSELALSDAVAFRAHFDGPLPPPPERYWRGIVLPHTDGVRWTAAAPEGQGAPISIPPVGPPALAQDITLEPHGKLWLFALDRPVSMPEGARLTASGELRAQRPVLRRFRYTVRSAPGAAGGGALDAGAQAEDLAAALALPPVSERVRSLARGLREGAGTGDETIRRALEHFRREPFVYTLMPPLLGPDPVDEFLFEAQAGFCEHYASAFTVLMRGAGLPARVVTGYLGGEENPLGGYLLVLQADAHAWSEVWLEGRGWVRVDPTAAVAPERLERSILQTRGQGAVPVFFSLPESGTLAAGVRLARAAWDLVGHGWNRWVLGYDQTRQRHLLARLGYRGATWRGLAGALAAGAGVFLGVLALSLAWRGGPGPEAPELRAYRRFCRKLARAGVGRPSHEGPAALAARVSEERADLALAVRAVTEPFIRLRYVWGADREVELTRLRRAVRAFGPGRRTGPS